jgi:DNA (cytosine-5)-methyltransferase 1
MVFRPIEVCEWAKNENDIYIGECRGKTGVCRKLTPMECLRLMGYDDNFKIVVPDKQMYRQSGNSIVVNVMERIMEEIIKTGVFNEQ